MTCYLCGSDKNFKRSGKLRDNHPDIKVVECLDCGFVFLSKIVPVDYRNTCLYETESGEDEERRFTFLHNLMLNKTLLDFGCGNGNFLWYNARWVCSEVAGLEPCLQTKERVAKPDEPKVPIYRSLDEIDRKFDIITMFHSIEHLPDPRQTLIDLKEKLNISGTLIIETPNATDALLTLYDCKAFQNFTYWVGHPYLFNAETLARLAEQAGYKTNYVQNIQRYPLSNHLYWLSNRVPGGHKIWHYLDCGEYDNKLCELGVSDTIWGNFTV